MLPVVLSHWYREKNKENIAYKPYQFLPFQQIFDKSDEGFRLKKEAQNQLILNDDHGVGLKVETGIILRELLEHDPELRILIWSEAEQVSAWKEEMYTHFGLDFHRYGEHGKCDSDLLLVNYDEQYELAFNEFDVQVISGLNYYDEEFIEERCQEMEGSSQYLLRILLHSDCILEEEEKNTIPRTDSRAVTVSGFEINKSVEWCQGNKTDFLMEYLETRESENESDYFRAIIFTDDDKITAALKAHFNDREYGIYKYSSPTGNAADFERSLHNSAFLVCSCPFGLDLEKEYRLAIHGDIPEPKRDSKRNGIVCRANRKAGRGIDIVYLADETVETESDRAKGYIAAHQSSLQNRAGELERMETEMEHYLAGGSAEEKEQLHRLREEDHGRTN